MKTKLYLAALFAILLCNTIIAQDSTKINMEAVRVTAYRFAEPANKIPFTTKKITNTNWNMLAPTTAEVLSNSGAVIVQKSQSGGGSPIIRGFEASRILLMIDGVRMNNAIYRAGHLQNIITIDPNALAAIDILYGPASTQFGSDALGGVISMYTQKPVLNTTGKTKVSGAIASNYASANSQLQTHAQVNIGGNKWASFTSLTYSDFGDVKQGDKRDVRYPNFGKKPYYISSINGNDYVLPNGNYNKQKNSAYTQVDLLQKFLFAPKKGQEHIINLQYTNSSNIPRYDRLTELAGVQPRFAEWYYGPQKRALASYQANIDISNNYLQKIQSILAYQAVEESRYDRRLNNKNRNSRIENVHLITYTLDGLHKQGKEESHIGIDLQLNDVQSVAFSKNVVTNVTQKNINTRYPDGKNKMSTAAAYFQEIYSLTKKINISGGVRVTQVNLTSNFVDKTVSQFPFSNVTQSNTALSGNAGITYNSTTNWKLAAIISTGFRAANIDDMGKVFDSRAGSLVVPNANLKPEYTYNAEVNANKYVGTIQVGTSIYYTQFKNAILVDNFTFNGQSSIVYQGVNSAVLASQNKAKAFLYGASIFAKAFIQNNTVIEATGNYTKGRVKGTNGSSESALDHIPPVYGKVGITHNQKLWNVELYSLYNGWKRLKDYSTSGEDYLQYATVDGMPSWVTINLHTTLTLSKQTKAMVGVENILDKNYRVFASGLSAPGRNFIVSIRADF